MNTKEIKIIGVGKSGIAVLEGMKHDSFTNTDLIVCDIASNNLSKSSIENKIQLVTGKARTLTPITNIEKDCHLNVELDMAMDATINAFDEINSIFTEYSKMAIVITDLGETTGTGVTPVIAQIAKNRDLSVMAIVLTPFDLMGKNAKQIANYGLEKLDEDCDFVIVIDNNKLQKIYGKTSLKNFAKKTEQIIIRLLKLILPLESKNSEQLHLVSFLTRHRKDKNLFIGIGEASGKWRARQAIEEALKNILYYRDDIQGTTTIFLDIYFGNTIVSTDEQTEIKKSVIHNAGKNANVKFSLIQDISLEESISIIVIAY